MGNWSACSFDFLGGSFFAHAAFPFTNVWSPDRGGYALFLPLGEVVDSMAYFDVVYVDGGGSLVVISGLRVFGHDLIAFKPRGREALRHRPLLETEVCLPG